nr:subtilisin-like protease SBT5.5 isoform X2 [Quercus suber]
MLVIHEFKMLYYPHIISILATMKRIPIIFILLLLPLLASCVEQQVYIVYFGEHSGENTLNEIKETHHSYLLSVKKNEEEARASLIYSYKHSINGFAALLTPEEASQLSELEEVVSVYQSNPRKYSLHTTRSWEFLGLDTKPKYPWSGGDLLSKAKYGEEVIVGVLDSGVWPESKSFSDEGMGPVPKSWKGICQTGVAFNSSNCNRKLIGARYYLKGYEKYYGSLNTSEDYRSPRDKDGHGTHTTSTVGGRRVHSTSAIGGFAHGTASGGAPLVRLAIYKVCWPIPGRSKAEGNTCFDEDMLEAIDNAIADGVDVLSISIGTNQPNPYAKDGIAIGSLHAAKKNIVVSCSAGNSGPAPSTLSNPAPWIITVGASSIDREFVSPVLLGNGMKFEPDITAPGLNILAAWSEADPPTKLQYQDNRIVQYNIISGTSMSCPHVSAVAALLKAIHPTWSGAAIRSALMTTATLRNNLGLPLTDESGNEATPFAYGSGHLRPTKAADPGLVYDASYTDYLLYFCSTNSSLQKVDPTFKCPKALPTAIDLNYPSLAIHKLNGTVTVNRTVTNVGPSKSVYFFSVRPPLGFSIKASPSILFFNHVGQKKSFTITVQTDMLSKPHKDEYAFGGYTWTDGVHFVRSPMAVSLA